MSEIDPEYAHREQIKRRPERTYSDNKLTQPLRELVSTFRKYGKDWSADKLESLLPAIDREIEAGQAKLERATDLVRYARHFLHEEGLISDLEYAAIVEDDADGKRVARLEGYDKVIADLRDRHDAELRRRWEGEK